MGLEHNDQLARAVRAFVGQALSLPVKRLVDDASLFHDLGVDGQDAAEFLDAYARQFGVSTVGLSITEFFGEEHAATPAAVLKRLFGANTPQKKRLTVRDLVIGAETGTLRHLNER